MDWSFSVVAGKADAASALTFEVEGDGLFALGFGVVFVPQDTLDTFVEGVPQPADDDEVVAVVELTTAVEGSIVGPFWLTTACKAETKAALLFSSSASSAIIDLIPFSVFNAF